MSAQGWIRACGWAGLLASILVGTGEFLLHFTPDGGIQDQTSYLFFNEVSESRLSMGHYIAVLSAPLYVLGYYFLSKQLEPAGRKQAKAVFVVGAYSFMIGAVWIGQRYFLGETVHAIAAGTADQALLTAFSEHNEPLVNVLRVAMLIVSILWIKLILSGKTPFPKWLAIFSPIVILVVYCRLILSRDHSRIIFVPHRNECDAFYRLRTRASHDPKQTY